MYKGAVLGLLKILSGRCIVPMWPLTHSYPHFPLLLIPCSNEVHLLKLVSWYWRYYQLKSVVHSGFTLCLVHFKSWEMSSDCIHSLFKVNVTLSVSLRISFSALKILYAPPVHPALVSSNPWQPLFSFQSL